MPRVHLGAERGAWLGSPARQYATVARPLDGQKAITDMNWLSHFQLDGVVVVVEATTGIEPVYAVMQWPP